MARGVALLYDTGQQHDLRAEPDLLPGAVWEILRVTTPAPLIGRHIKADVEASGKVLRRGERALMLTYTTNNAVGRFDIRRSPDRKIRQLWFGAGSPRLPGRAACPRGDHLSAPNPPGARAAMAGRPPPRFPERHHSHLCAARDHLRSQGEQRCVTRRTQVDLMEGSQGHWDGPAGDRRVGGIGLHP